MKTTLCLFAGREKKIMNEENEKELTVVFVKEIQNEIQRWKTERILLLFLDKNKNIFYKKIVSEGYNKYAAYYYPNKVTELIDETKPAGIVWAHNHVNNFPEPGPCDDNVHCWLMSVCKERNITLYDNIIIMKDNNDYYSYREHNRLDIMPAIKR